MATESISPAAKVVLATFDGLSPAQADDANFGHDPAKWEEFRDRYFTEFDAHAAAKAAQLALIGPGRFLLEQVPSEQASRGPDARTSCRL